MSLQLMRSFILFLLLIIKIAVAADPPLAKNNCTDHCGNVSIPYPFGIGAECALNSTFEISCDNQSLIPVLTSIQMEVVKILLKGGGDYNWPSIVVKSPVISKNCPDRETNVSVNFRGTPFFCSAGKNKFIAAGCENRAFMVETESAITGCETGCRGNTSPVLDRTCDGDTCCAASIPFGLQLFDARFETKQSNLNDSESEGCKLAFVVETDWFDRNYSVAYMGVPAAFPAVLWWEIDRESLKLPNSSKGYYCKKGEQTTSETCFCSYGYSGNPYLPNGCQGADECMESVTRCKGPNCWSTVYYICQGNNKKFGAILGLSIGFGLLLLFVGGWRLYMFLKKRRIMQLKNKNFKRNGGLLLEQQMISSEGDFRIITLFSSKELDKATDRFNKNRILGQGGQGTVYKGMLVDGRIVAVKQSKALDADKVTEFINELFILSKINHRNVVKLLGCCLETEVPLLVYEFISNGTLFHYLHDQNEEYQLSWEMRLRIAIETAEAISYLHSSASLPIYHRDIKSANILLDNKYRAKVSDFGISRSLAIDQTHLTTNVQGTFGYLDPEYFQSSQFTAKSDVYSFGVVLVELITGEKPISIVRAEEGRSLATHFILLMEDNRLFDIVDTRIMQDSVHMHEEITAAAKIAYRCLRLRGRNRPTMKEVAVELQRIPLLQKDSNVQQTQEEVGTVISEICYNWDAVTTSTGSTFDTKATSSLEMEPFTYTQNK